MKVATKTILTLAVIAVVGAAIALTLTTDRTEASSTSTAVSSNAAREFVTVERRDLRDTKEFTAEVGYGETWTLPFTTTGTVTARHDTGTIVAAGDPVIWIDALPLFFADGELPLYRELRRTTIRRPGVKAHPLSGDDVAQLQRFLAGLGYDDGGKMKQDGVFTRATEHAVKAWQKANDLDQTGSITGAHLIFSPTSVRIASAPRVGSPFDGVQVTAPRQLIVIQTARRDARYLEKGASVAIDTGTDTDTDTTISGTVTKTEEKHDPNSGDNVLEATIVADAPLPGDVAAVTVTGTGVAVEDAVSVPVRALIALSEGGYAVEIQTAGDTTELRRVDVGEILEGFAVITGDVSVGDRVVVAS